MWIKKLALIALVAGKVHSYLDTSPFFLFSTSEFLIPNAQLRSAGSITSDVSHMLSQCPSNIYILVTQPGVSASDYASPGNAPALARYMTAGQKTLVRSSTSTADVVGTLDINRWQGVLEKECGVTTFHLDTNARYLPEMKDKRPTLLKVLLSMPPPEESSQILQNNDLFFATIIDAIPSQNYTVLYTTTPPAKLHDQRVSEASKYEMETILEEVMHLDLKRDTGIRSRQSSSNQTLVDGPLFEKYQFLSPGIFMGFSVGFILLSILYVAVSGVAGMQVSYAAFDKESGHPAHKKSQ